MRLRTATGRAVVLSLAALLLLGVIACADQPAPDKYQVTLSTDTMLMPFKLPALPPGVTLPPGVVMPDLSAPRRDISGLAHYPTAAVAPVYVTVPADLGLPQNQLQLQIPQPMTPPPGQPEQPGQAATPAQHVQFTTKLYWHPETAQGPITNSVDMVIPAMGARRPGAPPAMPLPANLEAEMAKEATGSADIVPKTVVGQGNYVLNTGGLTAPLDGFLPALKVTSPDSLNTVDLTQPIAVQWDPVAGARGFILHVMAMYTQGDAHTMIQWVSTLSEPPERVRSDYVQATTIADDVANGILLPPDATSCLIPGGIFDPNPQTYILTVTAVGNDFYSQANGATIIGTIRAKWTAMKMPGMMGGMGLPGGGMPPTPPEE